MKNLLIIGAVSLLTFSQQSCQKEEMIVPKQVETSSADKTDVIDKTSGLSSRLTRASFSGKYTMDNSGHLRVSFNPRYGRVNISTFLGTYSARYYVSNTSIYVNGRRKYRSYLNIYGNKQIKAGRYEIVKKVGSGYSFRTTYSIRKENGYSGWSIFRFNRLRK